MREADKKRFYSFIQVTPSCWNWLGGINSRGYGVFWFDRSTWRAHRFSYRFYNGECPQELLVRHKCDNPVCVNPEHLEIGTAKDNTQDAVSRSRMASGSRNGMATLTDTEVSQIRDLLSCNLFTQRSIGSWYGIRQGTISKIHCGANWKS